jgi:hypothetical protein
LKNEEKVNASKYRKKTEIKLGDTVLVRNYKRKVKFDPIFLPKAFKISEINRKHNYVTIISNDKKLQRHIDDIKPFYGDDTKDKSDNENDQYENISNNFEEDFDLELAFEREETIPILRRSNRTRMENRLYYNKDYETY